MKSKKSLIIIAILALVAVSITGTYAWFTGSIKGAGAAVSTGKINLAFMSYKYNESDNTLTKYIDETIGESSENAGSTLNLASALQSSVAALSNVDDTDEVYFVVKKKAGSIPVDVQLDFELAGLFSDAVSQLEQESLTYAGGFWYNLQDITKALETLNAGEIKTDNGLANSLEAYAKSPDVIPTAQRYNILRLSTLSSNNVSDALRDGSYSVFRLTIGLDQNAANAGQYLGKEYVLNVSLSVAQEGGLEQPLGNAETYYVSNAEELNYYMGIYKPGDSIVVSSDFEYYGDLVFPRPVNLYLNNNGVGHTLKLYGNLILSYPYEDAYAINTSCGGRIMIRKYNNAGGNFNIDVPNSSCTITGSNNPAAGKGDIYVEGSFTVNTNCLPDTEIEHGNNTLAGYGLTIIRSRILAGSGSSESNQNPKRIYVEDASSITISNDTTVGQIYAGSSAGASNSRQIVVVNYGTISQGIDLSSMVMDGTAATAQGRHIPQILIDNYGTISPASAGSYSVALPNTSQVFSKSELSGNTWIIRQMGASDSGVSETEGFKNVHIYAPFSNVYVADVDGDGNNLRVYYTSFAEEDDDITLGGIMTRYLGQYNTDGTTENAHTQSFSQVTKLTVMTPGDKVLTTADFTWLRTNMTSLTTLDLGDARAAQTSASDSTVLIATDSFNGMVSLTDLTLPVNSTRIGSYAFRGTGLTEVTLPYSVATVDDNALSGITYVHVKNESAVVKNLRYGDSGRYLFVPGSMLETYRSTYTDNHHHIFIDAVMHESGNFFYRVLSANRVQISAYVGTVYSSEASAIGDFNFSTLTLDGVDYSIAGYDDYAFYGKIVQNTAMSKPWITLNFSDSLSSIGNYAFYGCKAIGSSIIRTADAYDCSVGAYAFYDCIYMDTASLENVVTIGNYAYYNCSNLLSIRGEKVKKLGNYAFYACSKLAAAYFPIVTDYGTWVFYNCTSLLVLETGVMTSNQTASVFSGNTNALVLWNVHTGNHDGSSVYMNHVNNTEGGHSSRYRILVDGNTIPGGTSTYASLITNSRKLVTTSRAAEYLYYIDPNTTDPDNCLVPSSVTDRYGTVHPLSEFGYGDYVLELDSDGNAKILHCLASKIVGDYTLPSSVIDANGVKHTITEIGADAFRYVTFENATIHMPGTIKKIGAFAFYERDGIRHLDLDGVTWICDRAFYDIDTLYSASGDSVERIDYMAFAYSEKLVKVSFNSWITSDGHANGYVFINCSALQVAELSLTTAGSKVNSIFQECNALKMIIVQPKEVVGNGFSELYNANTGNVKMKISPAASRQDGTSFTNGYGNFYGLTGDVQPEDYLYFDEPSSLGNNVTRAVFEYNGADTYLSDIGYGDYLVVPNDSGMTLVRCNLTEITGTYRIPSTYTGSDGTTHNITAIGDNAFRGITFTDATVIIPDTVASIGDRAFQDCKGITAISFPDSPFTVGVYTFGSCTGLWEVKLGGATRLDSYAFYNCTALRTVEGNQVTYIGYMAFQDCGKLLKASFRNWTDVPTSSTSCYTFYSCRELRVLEAGIVTGSNGRNIFDNIYKVRMMIVNTEGFGAAVPNGYFYTPSNGNTVVKIVDGSVNENGDTFISSMGSYTSNSGSVPSSQYQYANDTDPRNASAVVRDTFDYNGDDVPDTLSSIGYGDYVVAVNGSSASLLFCTFTEISGDYYVPQTLRVNGKDYTITSIASNAYRSVTFTDATIHIGSNITNIGYRAFSDRTGIVSLDFPDTPFTIEYEAFYGITTLTSVDVKGATSLGSSCFSRCTGLLEADGANVEILDTWCFGYCSKLIAARFPAAIHLSSSFTTSNVYTFYSCTNLRMVELGIILDTGNDGGIINETSNVKAVIFHGSGSQLDSYSSHFYYNAMDTPIKLVDNTTVSDGSTLESKMGTNVGSYGNFDAEDFLCVPDTVNSGLQRSDINGYTLRDVGYDDYVIAVDGTDATIIFCTLDKISGTYRVPSGFTVDGTYYKVKAIGGAAYMATTFEDVNLIIPSGISSIGNRTFYNRSGILSVSFSSTPCTIGYAAFSGLSKISELELNGVTSLGGYAFSSCSSLTSVTGENVASVGTWCFSSCTHLVAVRLPNLTDMGTASNLYLFYNCKYLKVFETGVLTSQCGGGNLMNGVDKAAMIIVHTDDTTPVYVSYDFYNSSTASAYKLMDGNSYLADGSNLSTKINTNWINTGDITADDYHYADDVNPANTVTQLSVYNKGVTTTLSHFGYGDYVFGIKDGKAYLVYCTLTEIKGAYTLPESFTVNGVSYPLGGIGVNAFCSTKFTNVKLTIPASVEWIGESAFYDCSSVSEIHIENGLDTISAVNFFGNRKNMTASDLKVYVGEYVYTSYTAAGTWAEIPAACFISSGKEYQPVAGGPVFHLDATGFDGNYNLIYVSGLSSETSLTIPDTYSDGGKIVSISDIFYSNIGGGVPLKTIVLPTYLETYSPDVENLPATLEEYIISDGAVYFTTENGLLLSKDGSMLVSMPRVASASAITLPESIKVVASKAFAGVDNLESLTIAEGCSVVFGDNAFVNCTNLATVTFEAQEPSYFTGYESFVNCNDGLQIRVPEVSAALYASAAPLDAELRSRMTTYERSYEPPHVCSYGEISWYISFDGSEGLGTQALAVRRCSECGHEEIYHVNVEDDGNASVDIDGDGVADSTITFLPFAQPSQEGLTLMCCTLPEAAGGSEGSQAEGNAETGSSGESGGDGDDGGEGESSDGENSEGDSNENDSGQQDGGEENESGGQAGISEESSQEQTESGASEENVQNAESQSQPEAQDDSSEQGAESNSEEGSGQNTEAAAEETSEQNTEAAAEETSEQSTEAAAEETSEQSTEAAAEETSGQSTEAAAEETSEQNTEAASGENSEQSTEAAAE